MCKILFSVTFLSFSLFPANAAYLDPRSPNTCQPFFTNFPPSSVLSTYSNVYSSAPFVAISPQRSYQITPGGLELYLRRPEGDIKVNGSVNDKIAEGATINSTFTLLYGRITFEIQPATIAGVVTAAILIANEHDEIDIELLGGDAAHWQTNIFSPSPKDERPLFGVFSSNEDIPNYSSSTIKSHAYTIDWRPDMIEWGVDGKVVRTLKKEQTRKDGVIHYPSHPARIQLGIWDASNPVGTSEWARGPIRWKEIPRTTTIKAIVKRITVECHGPS